MHRLLACLLLLVLAVPAAAETDRAAFIRFAQSLVKVEAVDEDGRFYLGTGVAIAPGTVVTSCHVTRNANNIRLIKGGLRFVVNSEWNDLEHDVCLLYSAAFDAPAVPMGSAEQLKFGQKVAAIGFTGGLELQVREGTVEGLHRLDGSNVIQTSAAFTSGASGGGLFDEQGRLVGILTFRLRGVNGYYFSTPVDWLRTGVGDRSHYGKVAAQAGPVPFWQRPLDSLPYFMQALSLAADRKWSDVVQLTDKWSVEEMGSAEPWFARGYAYTQLDRPDAAIKAYRKAVTLDPMNSLAWFNLGRLYQSEGQSKMPDVREALRKLDAHLFKQLLSEDKGNAKN